MSPSSSVVCSDDIHLEVTDNSKLLLLNKCSCGIGMQQDADIRLKQYCSGGTTGVF